MTKEKMDLQELSAKMDDASISLSMQLEVMEDIKTNFSIIVEDMNNNKDNLRFRFDEWHRELRILSQLMHYSMKEAAVHKSDVSNYSEGLFDGIVRSPSEEMQR